MVRVTATGTRNAVTELMNWFATNPTGTGEPDILMIGDYNSYARKTRSPSSKTRASPT